MSLVGSGFCGPSRQKENPQNQFSFPSCSEYQMMPWIAPLQGGGSLIKGTPNSCRRSPHDPGVSGR